jgi:hypothetical protein
VAADLVELLAWLRAGRVALDARVLLADGRLVTAAQLPGAAAAAPPPVDPADPWAAWDQPAPVVAPAVRSSAAPMPPIPPMAPAEPDELPLGALEPVSGPVDPAQVEDLPNDALQPVPVAQRTEGRFVIAGPPRPAPRRPASGGGASRPGAASPPAASPPAVSPPAVSPPAASPPAASPPAVLPPAASPPLASPTAPAPSAPPAELRRPPPAPPEARPTAPRADEGRVRRLPERSARAAEAPPVFDEAEDNVIAFPGPSARARTAGSAALALRGAPAPAAAPAPAPERAALRWGRVALIGALGALAAAGANWSVRSTAMTSFPPLPPELAVPAPPGAATAPPVPAPPAPAPPPSPATAPDPDARAAAPAGPVAPVDPRLGEYAAVEAELRALLPSGEVRVESEDGLEDMLLVGLSRMKLRGVKVKAKVVGQTEGGTPRPAAVELRVTVRTDAAELDRTLGAVALVVGRVAQQSELALPRFEVLIEGLPEGRLRRDINGQQARELYLGRTDLLRFLTGG